MLKPGLVSITFRQLSVDQIIDACLNAGLGGIEWGGDIHVPHGNITTAEEVKEKTELAGLEVASYGSYYHFSEDNLPFSDVLNTAQALGAPVIRAWAGKESSVMISEKNYYRIVNETRAAADLCERAGTKLAFEYHGNTITDTNSTAVRFIQDVNHRSVSSYWQPPAGMSKNSCLDGIEALGDNLQWVHVFHWQPDFQNKRNLIEGQSDWIEYFHLISTLDGDRWALLEFVKDDSLENFYEDAETLKRLLDSLL